MVPFKKTHLAPLITAVALAKASSAVLAKDGGSGNSGSSKGGDSKGGLSGGSSSSGGGFRSSGGSSSGADDAPGHVRHTGLDDLASRVGN